MAKSNAKDSKKEDADRYADMMRDIYDSFIEKGFSEEQSFYLLVKLIKYTFYHGDGR